MVRERRSGPLKVQVATFRSDGAYSDGRRPDAVTFSSAREDAERRDFTINGMFFDPLENRLIDYVGGQDDLRGRVLRHRRSRTAHRRGQAANAAGGAAGGSRFDFAVEPATAAAIKRMAPEIGVVSAERIAEEFRKMLVDRHRKRAMQLFMDLGLAQPLLPELLPMCGLPQGLPRADGPGLPPPGMPAATGWGNGDLWEHVLRVLDLLGERAVISIGVRGFIA